MKVRIDKEHIKRLLAQRNYSDYVEYVHGGAYQHAAHTRLICRHLEEVVTGKNLRKMFFLPPRHSKSMTITETFPSYYLGKNQNKRVISTAYGDDLATQFGRRNRDKVFEYGYLFGTKVSPDKSSARLWELEGSGGAMLSTQIGAGITGHGADLLIIDDPVKNDADVSSATQREHVHREYLSTLRTRLHAEGNIIVIMTRWHEDDLAGRLLLPVESDSPESWEVISLPAICETEGDVLGRRVGDPLWPERGYDMDWANRTKTEVGSRAWAALYQQRPAPAEGNIIKRGWWKHYTKDGMGGAHRLPTSFDSIIQSWDLTFKETKQGSYVVGQVWGKNGANAYLLDQYRERVDFVGTQKAIVAMTSKHPRAGYKYIEEAANGAAIISTLKSSIAGIIPIKPDGSKEARAYAVTPYIESGNVYLPTPEAASWVDGFIDECTSFPNAQNDDQTDCMTQALKQLYKPSLIQVFR